MKEILKRLFRKYFIMGAINRPIVPFKVNLLYVGQSFKKNGVAYYNVGDYLSKIIFEMLMKHFNIKSYWTGIIQFVGQNCVVYGSGFLFRWAMPQFARKKLKLDVRAVRGPLTREVLMELGYQVPEIYGDPAILLPLFFTPLHIVDKKEFVVIPHESHYKEYQNKTYPVLSTLTNDWRGFIEGICSAKLVISSSLHGIIIAEAYGIPAVFLDETENSDQLKYDDYYQSTGRNNYVKAKTVEECLGLTPERIPNFTKMREDLLNAFPKDLFS